jgi:allantoin racemase
MHIRVILPIIGESLLEPTWLESSVRLGLTTSRTTYMPPPAKDRCA